MAETFTVEEVHSKLAELMPPLYKTLVGKDGITSSEANYLAEKIKETNRVKQAQIDATGPASEIINMNGKAITISNPERVEIGKLSEEIGLNFGFSAWLRSAVKAKVEFAKILQELPDSAFSRISVDPPKIQRPVRKTVDKIKFTEDDAFASLGVKEYAEYLRLNAIAAAIGKVLHNEGKLASIRKELLNFSTSRFHALNDGQGKKDHIVERYAVYTQEEINQEFIRLMDLHRQYEQKLNWYKSKVNNIVAEKQAEAERQYRKELLAANMEFDQLLFEYNEAMDKFNEELKAADSSAQELRYKCISIFASYKVIIPDMYLEIYEALK